MLKNTPKEKKCAFCKEKFLQVNLLVKYCSPQCLRNALNKKTKQKSALKKREKKKKDTDWALAVKERDGFRCVYCGSKDYLNSHHIFSRNNLSTRHDLDNGITLCAKHHTFSKEFSAHQTPTEFTFWLQKLKGKNFIEELGKKARKLDL